MFPRGRPQSSRSSIKIDMSYYLRILGLFGSAVLAISALGSALPLRSISQLLESTLGGSAKSISETRVKRHRSLSRDPVQTDSEPKSKPGSQFTIYLDANQNTVCRAATSRERKQMDAIDPETLGLRPINHLRTIDKTQGIQTANAAPNLTIVLQATPQLQQNAAATTAFTRAAQNWEAIIKSPITIYIDVDYGSTRFGQPWPSGVIGSTSTPSGSYPFQSVRTNLIAEANGEGNAAKQGIFTSLPSNTVPTDVGDASSTDVADSSARAIGLLPATAQSTDSAARIAFNSGSFTFDFDPSDGITVGQVDFDAVAT